MCGLTLTTFCGALSEKLTVIRVGKKFNAHLEPTLTCLFDKRETLVCSWCQFSPFKNLYPVLF
jgi:hypothetical protein